VTMPGSDYLGTGREMRFERPRPAGEEDRLYRVPGER
jgi:hypothetical protein